MRSKEFRKGCNYSIGYNCLLLFFSNLVIVMPVATELVHHLPPSIIVNHTSHWHSPKRRQKIALTSYRVTIISPQGRWNVWVSGSYLNVAIRKFTESEGTVTCL
jgi:hypothetical protein